MPLSASELPIFLNDLAGGFTGEDGDLASVIVPSLSLFFQEWFKLEPTPDLLGNEWRRYIGAVTVLTRVKPIASMVRDAHGSDPMLMLEASNIECMDGTRSHGGEIGMAVIVGSIDATQCLSSRVCKYSSPAQATLTER